MAQLTREEMTKALQEAMYVVVGAGVMTVQHLDAMRHQLAERFGSRLDVRKDQLDTMAKALEARLSTVDDRVKVVEAQVDALLDRLQERLPEPAGDVLAKTRKATADARQATTDGLKAAAEAGEKLTARVRDIAA